MSDHIYKIVDIVGSSSQSIEDGVQQAITRASHTIDHLEWFKIEEVRGSVANGKVDHYQVVLKLGFRLN